MRLPAFLPIPAAFVCAMKLSAVGIPPGGFETSASSSLKCFVDGSLGRSEKIAAVDGGKDGCRLIVTRPDAAKSFLAQASMPCPKGAFSKGDKVLVVVKARIVGGVRGETSVKLQLAEPPYTEAAGMAGLDLSSEWTEFPVLLVVTNPIPEGHASLNLFCGQLAQTVEIADARVIRYPANTDTSRFPRVRRTYAGRDADAPWRKAALERIENTRKRNLSVRITGPDGNPVANVPMKLKLRRNEFGFGTAVPASLLVAEKPDAEHVRDIIDRLFSRIVFENDLKDFYWHDGVPDKEKAARRNELDKAFAWLEQRHIPVRGHYLLQVAESPDLRKVTDPEAIRRRYLDTTRQRLDFVNDRVCEWDVINHPIAWSGARMLTARPGLEHLDREVLALARGRTKLPLFVNEDQLFRPGHQSEATFDYLRALKADGYPIDGLGNQAHTSESYLAAPEYVLSLSDEMAGLAPSLAITEFDIETNDDEDLAADYTRDLLIACFSHPAYRSFMFWGFWEGSHWKPNTASWKKDWTIRKRGEVLEEWLGKRWRTELTLTTDASGNLNWRGFPGWYEICPEAETKRVAGFNVTTASPSTTAGLPSN